MHLIAIQNECTKVRPDAKIISIHVCHRNNEHLNVVWIRSAHPRDGKVAYVVWTFNIQSGGLCQGSYDLTYGDALLEFNRRISLLDSN